MFHRLSFWVVCAALWAPLADAAETKHPSFPSRALRSDGNTPYTLTVSTDKKSGHVILDELQVDHPHPARVFSLSLPIEGADKGIKLHVFVEGHVWLEAGVDSSLITTINGKPYVMDFATFAAETKELPGNCSGIELPTELAAAKRAAAAKKPAVDQKTLSGRRAGLDGDYLQCIVFEVPSASDLRMNLILAINSRVKARQGYVNATTITFQIKSWGD
jgi:hypothetical protein